jgi:hypothetical protein
MLKAGSTLGVASFEVKLEAYSAANPNSSHSRAVVRCNVAILITN